MNHAAYLNFCSTIYWTLSAVRDIDKALQHRSSAGYSEHNNINPGATNSGQFLHYLSLLYPDAGVTSHMEHISFSFGLLIILTTMLHNMISALALRNV